MNEKEIVYSIEDNLKSNIINDDNILRIIVVDDEKLIRKSEINIINRYFKNKNVLYEIEECDDGIECIYLIYKGILAGKKYDIILTDETMNFIKGSFMAGILKTLITDNVIYDLKIYLITSFEEENVYNFNSEYFEKVFSKPISKDIFDIIYNH